MEISLNAGTVIASAITLVLSSIISYAIYRSQKSVEFNYDYRKYILEKRKLVYELIEKLIEDVENNFKSLSDRIFVTDEMTNKFRESTNIIISKGIWVDQKMLDALWEFDRFLTEVQEIGAYNGDDYTPVDRHIFKALHIRAQIIETYFASISTFDKIVSFKSEKILTYKQASNNSKQWLAQRTKT